MYMAWQVNEAGEKEDYETTSVSKATACKEVVGNRMSQILL